MAYQSSYSYYKDIMKYTETNPSYPDTYLTALDCTEEELNTLLKAVSSHYSESFTIVDTTFGNKQLCIDRDLVNPTEVDGYCFGYIDALRNK